MKRTAQLRVVIAIILAGMILNAACGGTKSRPVHPVKQRPVLRTVDWSRVEQSIREVVRKSLDKEKKAIHRNIEEDWLAPRLDTIHDDEFLRNEFGLLRTLWENNVTNPWHTAKHWMGLGKSPAEIKTERLKRHLKRVIGQNQTKAFLNGLVYSQMKLFVQDIELELQGVRRTYRIPDEIWGLYMRKLRKTALKKMGYAGTEDASGPVSWDALVMAAVAISYSSDATGEDTGDGVRGVEKELSSQFSGIELRVGSEMGTKAALKLLPKMGLTIAPRLSLAIDIGFLLWDIIDWKRNHEATRKKVIDAFDTALRRIAGDMSRLAIEPLTRLTDGLIQASGQITPETDPVFFNHINVIASKYKIRFIWPERMTSEGAKSTQ